ncbi:MAG: tetratricopeptide repeat protein [Candidatus Omnitrophota bacterium]
MKTARCVFTLLVSFFLIQPVSFSQQEKAGQEIEEFDFANGLFSRGMYDMAVESYKTFLEKYPQSQYAELAVYRVCESYFMAKKYDEALKEYGAFIERYPGGDLARNAELRRGQIYYLLGDYDKAEVLLLALVGKEDAGAPRVAAEYYLAGVYFRRGDMERSKILLEKVLSESGNSEYAPFGYLNLGDIYFEENDFLRAAEIYQKAAQSGSGNIVGQALLRAGNAYLRAGNLKKAQGVYKKIIDEIGEESGVFDGAAIGLVSSLYRAGEYDRVIDLSEDLLRRVKDESVTSDILFMRANSFFYKDKFAEAEEIYAQLAEKYPGTQAGLKSWLNRCWSVYKSGDYGKCLSIIDAYLGRAKESKDEALYIKGKTLDKLKRTNDATSVFEKIVKDFKGTGFAKEALYELGWLYDASGKKQKAVQYYKKFAVQYPQDPRSPEILLKSGQENMALKRFTEAESDYDLFLSKYSASPLKENVLFQLGTLYLESENYDKTVETFERFMREFPESKVRESAVYWTARACQGKQDWDKAIKYYSNLTGDKEGRFYDIATEAIGYSYFQKGDYGKAAEVYYGLMTERKDYLLPESVYRWVAEYFLSNNQFDKSLTVLEDFTEKHPRVQTNGEIYYLMGESHIGLKEWEKAAGELQKAVNMGLDSPYLERSYLGLGRCKSALGNYEEALSLLEKALEKHKDNLTGALARFETANIKEKMMDYEEAAKTYMMVAILYEDEDLCARALFLAGMTFRKAGNKEKSIEAFRELIQRYPDNSLSNKAEMEIEKSEGEKE